MAQDLYEQAFRAAYHAARRRGLRHHEAEDVAQDVCLLLWQNRQRVHTCPLGWVVVVTHRRIIDMRRTLRSRTVHWPLDFLAENDEGRPLPRTTRVESAPLEDWAEARLRLREAGEILAGLSPAVRRAVMLQAAGYTIRDAAQVEGIPVGTLKSRTHMARSILRRRMVV